MSTINYIKGFNGIRAISILFVLMEHLAVTSHLPKWVAKYNYAFSGITGVFIFFTLSGFLITTILLTEKMNKGRVDYKKFFIRRLVRLGPPLLVFVLMVSALMYFELVERNYTAVFLSLIYVNNFIPHTSSYNISILKHTWSLAVEQQFYILWPIIINNIRTFKRYLITIGVLICICIVVFRVVTAQGQERNFLQQFMTRAWFIPACMPIMIGCIAGLMVMYKKETIIKIFRLKYWMLIISIIAYASPIIMPDTLDSFFISIGSTIFLLWIYFNQESFIVSFLELKPIAFLGKISYGVYIYQGLFLTICPCGNLPIQKFPLNLFLTFIVAIISYIFLEKKIMRYKHFNL